MHQRKNQLLIVFSVMMALIITFGSSAFAKRHESTSLPESIDTDQLNFDLQSSMGTVHTQKADALIASGADPHYSDDNWRILLHHAAIYGNVENMCWLVTEHDLDVMARDNYGNTPAHLAAEFGQLDAIVWLINHGANINARNDGDITVRRVLRDNFPDLVVQFDELIPTVSDNILLVGPSIDIVPTGLQAPTVGFGVLGVLPFFPGS
jgi:ankyrin repeat protein